MKFSGKAVCLHLLTSSSNFQLVVCGGGGGGGGGGQVYQLYHLSVWWVNNVTKHANKESCGVVTGQSIS